MAVYIYIYAHIMLHDKKNKKFYMDWIKLLMSDF